MDQANLVVSFCETHEQVQIATHDLQRAGINLQSLSVATMDTSIDPHDAGYYSIGDRTLIIPSIGPVLVRGPLTSWIVTALDDTGNESESGLSEGFGGLGIPRESVLQYEAALKAGKYLLVVYGVPAAAAAERVIGGTAHYAHPIDG